MNSFFAAGLFDNPWIIVAIVVISGLANWLSARRKAKDARGQPEGDEPSPSPRKSTGEFNLEEAMRRLMGEEPVAPAPAPPPIPRPVRSELPPMPAWREEGSMRQTVPSMRPPPIAVARPGVTTAEVDEHQVEAARRFEQLNEQGRHPATVIGHGRGYRSHASQRAASRWRARRYARQAFVASLVFAPPKGLEGLEH